MSITVNEPYGVLGSPAPAEEAPNWLEDYSRKFGAIVGLSIISFLVIVGCLWYKCFPSRKRRIVRGKDSTVVAVLEADARAETADIVAGAAAASRAKSQEKEPLLETNENSVEMKSMGSPSWLTAPPPRPIVLDPAVEENLKKPKFMRPTLSSTTQPDYDMQIGTTVVTRNDRSESEEEEEEEEEEEWTPDNLKKLVPKDN